MANDKNRLIRAVYVVFGSLAFAKRLQLKDNSNYGKYNAVIMPFQQAETVRRIQDIDILRVHDKYIIISLQYAYTFEIPYINISISVNTKMFSYTYTFLSKYFKTMEKLYEF